MAGEVALEAADRFAGALAFAAAAGDVVAGGLVAAGAGHDHAVKRSVDLAVAALVEPLAPGVAGAGGDRRDAGGAGELGRCREALGAGDLADELGGDQRPERLSELLCVRPGRLVSWSVGESVSEVDLEGSAG